MNLEMLTAKRGRKVVHVDIQNRFIKQNKTTDNEHSSQGIKVPLSNWLEK